MIVSGLVLTLQNDPRSRAHALETLSRDLRIIFGEAHGLRLPVVLETASLLEGEAACEALRNLEGIAFVDVVSIDFSSSQTDPGIVDPNRCVSGVRRDGRDACEEA
ncbi:MAG: hypothetical protein HYV09_28700 [Deltaproteobacteria bacterium]|nr:hypothetical protein [Deltaproteobacteria bacterium]